MYLFASPVSGNFQAFLTLSCYINKTRHLPADEKRVTTNTLLGWTIAFEVCFVRALSFAVCFTTYVPLWVWVGGVHFGFLLFYHTNQTVSCFCSHSALRKLNSECLIPETIFGEEKKSHPRSLEIHFHLTVSCITVLRHILMHLQPYKAIKVPWDFQVWYLILICLPWRQGLYPLLISASTECWHWVGKTTKVVLILKSTSLLFWTQG